jgi:hypothetical protein
MDLGFHVINGLVPVADAFDTIKYTDIIDAGGGEGVLFIIQTGATAGAGTDTIKVNACSTITATAETAVPFIYRECVATDVWGAWTAVASTGVSISTAVANSMWQVYVDSAEVAETGYRFVRLSIDETADHTVTAGVLALVFHPRYVPQVESLLD